jgi:ATP adenylyltransferase/5',5'''-P-1,P-4-tetraphosphate phosphorylase II
MCMYTLVKVQKRKIRKDKPIVIFDQLEQFNLGTRIKNNKLLDYTLLAQNNFLIVVPLFEQEYIFQIVNDNDNGFTLKDISTIHFT